MVKQSIYILVFVQLICMKPLIAQDQPIVGWYMPAMMPAKVPVPQLDVQTLVLPFYKAGNLMLIEATVDGQTGYFIFDTGAPYLVLNRTYFRKYPSIANYTALGISNVEVDIMRTRVRALNIRALKYQNIEADVADLSHLENNRKVKILGLLGTNLFTDFVVGIDFKAQNVTLYSPEAFQKISAKVGTATLPISLRNNLILMNGVVNGQKVQLVFDTGAEINVLGNDLAEAVYEPFIIQKRSTLSGSVGEEIEVFSGVLMRMLLNNHIYLNMKTIMTNLSGIGKVYGFRVDGILGYEFLIKGPVYIDFKNRQIIMQKKEFYE
jgi:predicted aspartyl protease